MMAESNVRPSAGGVAGRRRERRLRSWWRHEQQTIRLALAAATHHSAQQNAAPRGPKTGFRAREVEEQGTYVSLRVQKAPSPEERPGLLAEPGPQRSHRSRRHFSSDTHLTLGLPVLAGASGEVVDASTLAFLTRAVLEEKRKAEEEEQEAKRRKTHAEEETARVELRSLLDVPRSRRTAEHESRLDAVSQLLAAASRRKRKKKRKKRLPKSSARHPPSSGDRTGKSGHYSPSPSFWQSPIRCPGVARFNSEYSPCVSCQRLWISFSFSTCWTRILRSFLNLDILLRTPGIWQPLVRCLPCPGF